MTAAEIKEYLGMVVELEKEVYTQNRVIASLAYKLSALPGYRQYTKPVYNKVTLSHYDGGTADMVAFMCLLSNRKNCVCKGNFREKRCFKNS